MESPVVTEIQAPPVRHVIDPKFCYPSTAYLLVKPENGSFKKPIPLNVVDACGSKHFMVVRGDSLLMSADRLILDAGYTPIALIRRKKLSWENVWKVYGGKKASKGAALFKVMRRKDLLGLDVIMAAASDPKRKSEKIGEFHVGGRVLPTFYMNQSVVAYTVNKKIIFGKDGDAIEVRVNGGIDCAFILALLVIHGEMWRWKMDEPMLAPPPSQVEVAVGGGGGRPNMASSQATELPAARPYKLPLPPPDKALKDRRPSREKDNTFVGSSSTGGGHGGAGHSGVEYGGGGHGGHSDGGGGCGGGCGGGGCGGGGCGGHI